MNTHPRTLSLLAARTGLGVAALILVLLALWEIVDARSQSAAQAGGFAQKKNRVEEEEDPPAKEKAGAKKSPAKEEKKDGKADDSSEKKRRAEEEEDKPKAKPRKVIRVEEEESPAAPAGGDRPDAPIAGDLGQLADQAKHPGIIDLFSRLAVPHDLLVLKQSQRVTVSGNRTQGQNEIEPFPEYIDTHPEKYRGELKVYLLDRGKRGKEFKPRKTSIEYIRCYELIAQDEVSLFLKQPYDQSKTKGTKDYLSHFDMLVAAEQALSAVLRWHESARQTGRRRGSDWDQIEAGLRKRLLDDVFLKQMEELVRSRDWEPVMTLTRRLASLYTDKKDRQRIGRPVADLIENGLKNATASETQKQQIRKRLVELEHLFPDNPFFKPISDGLHKQAEGLLNRAKELAKEGKNEPAKDQQVGELLRQAEEIWPDLPGLHAFKIERSANHPVLCVGVRGPLPRLLSPAQACTDAELRAVELLFESLVKVVPHESGIFRYEPALAERLPRVVSLGRQFQLPRNARWYSNRQRGGGEQQLSASDIRDTVVRLKAGKGVGRSRAWGELFDRVVVKNDPYQVTLRLHQGYRDPLALMTFKILPQGDVDSEEFAKNPVSSGPFYLDSSRHSDPGKENHECVFFVANPFYGVRPSKRELPHIQEIHFYSYTDAVTELSSGNLDLVLDLRAEEVEQLQQKGGLGITVPLPPRAPNRRIYFLAINQLKVSNPALRKALAYAINREKLLNDHFRGKLGAQVHRALNGPFPPGSWACNPAIGGQNGKSSLDLFNFERAKSLSGKAGAELASLTLKYPRGDAVLDKAMKALCEQVKTATGITLEPTPCDPYRLRQDVEQTQSYDLAYYHYDYPDETYWLWPLLGPPLHEGSDTNIFKFTDEKILPPLKETMKYRDFAEVRKHQWAMQEALLGEMPFIPLWQLDPLIAYGSAVQPAALDPVLIFNNIENWRLRRK